MSELRETLDRAKGRHAAARYPGNLAVDVLWDGNALRPAQRYILPPRPPRWRVMLGWGIGASAAAAVVSMFFWLERTPSSRHRDMTWSAPAAPVRTVLHVPERPLMPPEPRLVPAGRLATPPKPFTDVHMTFSVPPRPPTPGRVKTSL
jgi:hypothetical protein